MPVNNCHIQTGSCMLIGVALDESCAIVPATPTFVTSGIANMSSETERQDPTDYSSPNFGGEECGPIQQGDTIDKWGNLSGEMCLIDWAFQSATSGNPVVLDGDDNVIGYAHLAQRSAGACSTSNKPRMALVVVRRAATGDGGCVISGATTGATSAVAHFFPATTDWTWDVAPFENARALIPFTMKAYTNPSIVAGPLNLWPATAVPNTIPDEAWHAEVFVDPAGLPTVNCDEPVAHPAIDVRA